MNRERYRENRPTLDIFKERRRERERKKEEEGREERPLAFPLK
jgi:hypothetical protein